LRLLEPGEGGRIVDQLRRRLEPGDVGARLGDPRQDFLLVAGIALHHRHEIRNQVGAALVLVEHFRPGGAHRLVVDLDLVVAAAGQQRGGKGQQGKEAHTHGNLR
jgi:hypothetical protein